MRKNIIKLLAILAMCFMVVGVLASCGKEEAPAADENNNQNQTTTPEMYIKDGTYWVGDFNTGFPASDEDREYCIDHEWHHVHTTQEHTQDGTPEIIFYGCLDCNYCYTVEVGHIYDTKVETVAVTCTTDGYTVYACRCGLTENRDVVPALGHSYDTKVDIVPATCTTDGYDVFECRCGLTENRNIVPALGHDLPVWNASWTYETVDTTVWTALTTITAADCPCEFVGKYDAKCTRCDVRTEVKETVKVEHSYTKFYPAVPDATLSPCLQASYEIAKCDNCNHAENIAEHAGCVNHAFYKETKPAPGHDWSAWTLVDGKPTKTATAEITRSCKTSGCGYVQTATLPVLNGTDYDLKVDDPSCVSTGLETYMITKDGTTFTFTVVIETTGGHKINTATAEITKEPTTTAAGEAKVVCPDCKAELTYVLPAIPTAEAYRNGATAGYTIVAGTCADPTVTFKLVLAGNNVEGDKIFAGNSVTVEYSIKDQAYHPHAVSANIADCIIAKDENGVESYFALCQNSDGCHQWIYVGPVNKNN